MSKRQFVMLAHVVPEEVNWNDFAGWFMSEKMDGQRVFWDGGITRGTPVGDVPFANTHKDHIRVNQNYMCTGLWSRNAKVIRAPDWFIDKLPKIPLDGEMWAGRGNWEVNSSIVRTLDPEKVDWSKVKFSAFDSPSFSDFFAQGHIDTDLYRCLFDEHLASIALRTAIDKGIQVKPKELDFEATLKWINNRYTRNDSVELHPQVQFPYQGGGVIDLMVETAMDLVIKSKGEGLMLRNPNSYWVPNRSYNLLKLKKWEDAEAVVMGYTWGKRTTKGSKHLGKMGAMVVEWNGKRFEIAGFTDGERELLYLHDNKSAHEIGQSNSGGSVNTAFVYNPKFPVGTTITFRYRELTAAGIPKSGNYMRIRHAE